MTTHTHRHELSSAELLKLAREGKLPHHLTVLEKTRLDLLTAQGAFRGTGLPTQ